jgi:ribosomal protein S18 acetylase RimI-like enzyme
MGSGGRPDVGLRRSTPGDEHLLREIYASTRDAEMAVVPWDEASKRQFLDLQHRAQAHHYETHNPHADYDVVLLDGQPIGRLYVDRTTEQIHLLDIALLAPFRSRGIGTALIEDLMGEARRQRRPLRCHVEKFNRAWSLYRRMGFRPIADAGMYAYLEWVPDTVPQAATAGQASRGAPS